MKKHRIKKLAKQEWIERMKWIKQIDHVQTLIQNKNPEYD